MRKLILGDNYEACDRQTLVQGKLSFLQSIKMKFEGNPQELPEIGRRFNSACITNHL